MPQAILSTVEYDPDAPITLDLLPGTDRGETARRMNRVATLDGGAVFNDAGHTESDRTIELRWQPVSAASEARIDRMVRLFPRITCATQDGLFLAAPERYTPGSAESRLRLLVERRLDTAL
jgi:hypothetical protein